MPTLDPSDSLGPGNLPSRTFGACFAEALRYWETRRIPYNIVLLAATVCWFLATWPHFRTALTLHSLLLFVILGGIANVCYCAAYLVDLPLQPSAAGAVWRRRRWALWLVGTLFAILLSSYWIVDEMYPDFH